MSFLLRSALAAIVLAAPAVLADPGQGPSPAPEAAAPDPAAPAPEAEAGETDELIAERTVRFLDHLEATGLGTAEERAALKKAWEAGLAEGEVDREFIENTVAKLHPRFDEARMRFMKREYEEALPAFAALQSHDDPYVRGYANYFGGRTAYQLNDYPEAARLLREALRTKTEFAPFLGEATFYTGMTEIELLLKGEAIERLMTFLNDFPEAPDRYRTLAKKVLSELAHEKENNLLTQLAAQMRDIERLLNQEKTNRYTQEREEKVVKSLAQLIEELEQMQNAGGQGDGQGQNKCQGPGCKKCGGKGCPGPAQGLPRGKWNPATKSTLPGGKSGTGDELKNPPPAPAGDDWAKLPAKEKEKILSDLKERFPETYRDLIEQYSKGIAGGAEAGRGTGGE